jgi:RNA polymerase sigma-70 factor, ECF subfamily
MDVRIVAGAPDVTIEELPNYVVLFDRFEDFYRREFPGLHAVARALSGEADSEDLVQDTMFKAFVQWDRVRRLERPGGWCHRVLLHACWKLWHRRNRQGQILRRYWTRQTVDEPSADVVAFWQAVRQLPTRPRKVVALYYGADRTTVDIASILDVPEGTVRSDLARARKVLAAQLEV